MTTTVTVKTRGHGASVTVAGESVQMGPNSERRFDTDDTMSLSLRQETAEEAAAREERDRVPGSEQNDALIQEVPGERLAEVSGQSPAPMGNETGATQAAATEPRRGRQPTQ